MPEYERGFNPEVELMRRRRNLIRIHMAELAMGLDILPLAERLEGLSPDAPPEMEVPD